jgi:hypothetical protein
VDFSIHSDHGKFNAGFNRMPPEPSEPKITLIPAGATFSIVLTWYARRGHAPGYASGYCLSQTIVARYALPSAFVPSIVLVIVLPSFETTLRPVTLYFPFFFFEL